MKCCLIVDFDGTLIDCDIERKFIRFLLSKPNIRWKLLIMSFFTLPINLILNVFDFPSILKSWTFVLGKDRKKYISEFILNKSDEIKLKNEVWELLNREHCCKIILSGSFSELIEAFLDKINERNAFNKIIACEVESNNLIVRRHPFGRGKTKYINTNNYNIGVANERRDKYYLNLCDEKIVV